MFFGIIGSSLNMYLNRVETKIKSLDAGSLKNLAALSAKVPELENTIFIPDGDMKRKIKGHKNILFLPGENRPETLIYNNLKATKGNHKFWNTCKSESKSYNKQFAIIKHGIPPKPSTSDDAKKWYKEWYKEQSPFWGNMDNLAYKNWASDNKIECKDFCQQFLKILNSVLQGQIQYCSARHLRGRNMWT